MASRRARQRSSTVTLRESSRCGSWPPVTITASASELAMPSNDVARWRQSSKFGHAMPEPCCSARKTRRSGVCIRQRPHQHGIRDRENRRRRADAEDEHGQRRDREPRRAPQHAARRISRRATPCRARSRGHHASIRSSASALPDRGGPDAVPLQARRPRERCASISRSRWSRSSSAISPSIRRRRRSPRSEANEPGDHRPSPRTRRIDSANASHVSVSWFRRFRPARVIV